VVPWLGGPFKTGQQVSDVVLGVISDVLQPGVKVGQAISPDRLYQGGRVDVQLLREAAPQLGEISTAATKLDAEAGSITDPHYLAVMRGARTEVQGQIADLSGLLRNASLAARLAPSMMGADGPRSYFMGFQTNAEARAMGGLLGGFGVLEFENGTPRVNTLGQNVELDGASAPIDLGPTLPSGTDNPSPRLISATLIRVLIFRMQPDLEVHVGAAIGNEGRRSHRDRPVALSYVLGAVGPVTMPDGEVITKDNVVELTESTTYFRYPTTNPRARSIYRMSPAKWSRR
jgi:hypothetical protein